MGRIGLGTAALAVAYGAPGRTTAPPEPDEAVRTIRAALERGVSLIDTAPTYGRAEELIGTAVQGLDCFVATKLREPHGGWSALSPEEIAAAVEASAGESLGRLGRERLDLLQVHNAGAGEIDRGALPSALVALRDAGIAALAGATVYGEADALAAIRCGAFDVIQVAYSWLDRRPERAVLPEARRHGVAVVARSVMLRGVLGPEGAQLAGAFAPLRDAADELRRAVGATWSSLPAAALAWVVERPGIDVALVGPRDERELDGLLQGAEAFAAAVHDAPEPPLLPPELIDPRTWPQGESRAG